MATWCQRFYLSFRANDPGRAILGWSMFRHSHVIQPKSKRMKTALESPEDVIQLIASTPKAIFARATTATVAFIAITATDLPLFIRAAVLATNKTADDIIRT